MILLTNSDIRLRPDSGGRGQWARNDPNEDGFGILDECPISFQLSWPDERLSQNDQSDDEPVSSRESIVLSSHKEPRRRFTPEYATGRDESDRSKSDFGKNEDEPSRTKSEPAQFKLMYLI